MHLTRGESRRTILLARNAFRSTMRTRGLREFLFGLQGGQLGLEGSDLLLKLGVVGDEGKDIHCSWGVGSVKRLLRYYINEYPSTT